MQKTIVALSLSLVVLSGLLRIPFLSKAPPELFGDEIDVGYQAFSLLKTGQDIYRHPMPVYLQSLAEWRLPLIVYQTVPTIAVFGLNEWGVRLPEAIFGTLAPVILFLLIYELTRSKSKAFLIALCLVFMPWHVMYSRMAAFGVVTLTDFLMLGTVFFYRRKFVLAAVFFVLTLFTYGTAIIFTPMLIICLILLIRIKPSFWAGALFGISLALFAFFTYANHGGDRFSSLTIFHSPDIINQLIILRNTSPSELEPLFANRFESWGSLFVDNYARAFSTDFLFVRGDPVARQSIQMMGELLPLSAPILLLGLYYLATRRQYIWLLWLVLAPIPSALTADGAFHATRLFLMVIPLAVAMGSGLYFCAQKFKVITWLFGLLILVNFIWFAQFYLVTYPKLYSRWWQVGFKSSLTETSKIAPNYQRVFINNTYEPSLMRFLFYTSVSPQKFHQEFTLDQPIANIVPGYNGFTLDGKYFFGSFATDAHLMEPDSLYVISNRDDGPPRADNNLLFTANDPLNNPIFYLVTKK